MVNTILKEISLRFARLDTKVRRPSMAPERLVRALLLQILSSRGLAITQQKSKRVE